MTNHPNRSRARYYKICPRGFANEVIYLRIHNNEEAQACEAYFAAWQSREFNAGNTRAYAEWTNDKRASARGAAVNWRDREYAGYSD